MDDYGLNISSNFDKIVTTMLNIKEAKIEIRRQNKNEMYYNGWVDYGISSMSIDRGQEYAEQIFKKCAQAQKKRFCLNIVDGVVYPCAALRRLVELHIIPPLNNEVINLFDKIYTNEEICERIASIYLLDVLSACAYCNGQCEDSKRFTPAEQLDEDELKLYHKNLITNTPLKKEYWY